MSVGGRVIEVMDCGDAVWVDTLDKRDACAIYVERTAASLLIEPGDSLWWQGSWAMWTPRAGGEADRRLRRIGCSGISRGAAIARSIESKNVRVEP